MMQTSDGSPYLDSSPKPSSPPCRVKRERSPSPPFERRLVTSGTKRFAPMPDDCLPSCKEHRQNRSKWVARCVKELEELHLTPERKLIRGDGLTIDWKSHVPVRSDTLKPDPMDLATTIMLTHMSNAQLYHSPGRAGSPLKSIATISTNQHATSSPPISGNLPDTEPPSKKRLPTPPRPSSKHRIPTSRPIPVSLPTSGSGSSLPCPKRPRFPDETQCETTSHSPPHDHVLNADRTPVPSVGLTHPPNGVRDRSIVPYRSSAEEEEITEMTLSYLRRYIQTYEADRASLASAYSRNASFAYRVHQITQSIGGDASFICANSRRFSSGTKQTRLHIVTALLDLPCLHSNDQSGGSAQIQYDIFYLGARYGMFVVCRVAISTQTVVHNFVLQRKGADVEDAATECVWPLMATTHQILVFQT